MKVIIILFKIKKENGDVKIEEFKENLEDMELYISEDEK